MAQVIDTTLIEPLLKHQLIFEKFDTIEPGSSFIVHDKSDPRPLHSHLLAAHGQNFIWKPLESGPYVWQVKITKKPSGGHEETISGIITKDYRKAAILKELGIDFSCGGKKTINEVCENKGLIAEEVNKLLRAALPPPNSPPIDFLNWDLGFLCKYIVQLHHKQVKINTSYIQELGQKLSISDSETYPVIAQVALIFKKASKLLLLNIYKEERELFPYITELSEAAKKRDKIKEMTAGPLSMPVYQMEAEHEKVVTDFQLLRQITNNFQQPQYISPSFGFFYKMLRDYEDDLYMHLHLENNILFSKAIKMENEMRQKNRLIKTL